MARGKTRRVPHSWTESEKRGAGMSSRENGPETKKRIALTVNGKKVERDILTRMTLAEFLREELDLTGTKVGCNRGECGSCTVIVDGDPVLSCTVLGVEAAGREVLTIEGLSSEGRLHPIQEAFVEHDALQCGYCTPGMIMSIKALLDKNSNPTDEDIRKSIDGNFCRCGSYPNVIKATIEASRKINHR
jgi:aerobic-type carbon monoxide dehydrogenase small subunit (CoxS/CutS family)